MIGRRLSTVVTPATSVDRLRSCYSGRHIDDVASGAYTEFYYYFLPLTASGPSGLSTWTSSDWLSTEEAYIPHVGVSPMFHQWEDGSPP